MKQEQGSNENAKAAISTVPVADLVSDVDLDVNEGGKMFERCGAKQRLIIACSCSASKK